MSSVEASSSESAIKLESDIERPALRPQRPPPPPPPPPLSSSPSEPFTHVEPLPISSGLETTPPSAETPNALLQNVENNRSSLLFEFQDLFDSFDYESIRNKILDREMVTCHFTTVLWRIFLHCLPRDSSQWNMTIDATRDNYNELVERYLIDPKKIRKHHTNAKSVNHPLSQDENDPWHQYYAHSELKENIDQDVRRTYPEIFFFRQQHILDLILKVLFIHSRHYEQSLPYRQGMHEILAIIIYSMYSESLKVDADPEASEMMKKLYDQEYLAHDAYAIYEKIMEHLRQFYDFKLNNAGIRKIINMTDNKQIPFQRSNDLSLQTNDTVMRVNSIFERLKDYDQLLYGKLYDFDIEPTVYGIRWLRLLFGREIPFGSIPILWTVIFCYDEGFRFVDYFFLALVIEIGQILRKSQTSGYSCYLQMLMQQNVISDAEHIIRKALTLTGRQFQSSPNEPTTPSIRRTDSTRLSSVENNRENAARAKELQRSTSIFSSQSISNHTILSEIQQPISPVQIFQQNPLMDLTKINSSNSYTQSARPSYPDIQQDSELAICPGKETRRQFYESIQDQKKCAEFMNKFIQRIRNLLCDLQVEDEEEMRIQLTGLEQIVNILEGTLTFDENSLQALVDYKREEQTVVNKENNNTDTASLE